MKLSRINESIMNRVITSDAILLTRSGRPPHCTTVCGLRTVAMLLAPMMQHKGLLKRHVMVHQHVILDSFVRFLHQ